jgi:hypothetical protein
MDVDRADLSHELEGFVVSDSGIGQNKTVQNSNFSLSYLNCH